MWAAKRQHFINILGLGIGLSVVLLIGLYLKTELSFDKHINNHQNKYRLLKDIEGIRGSIFPNIAGSFIQNNIAGIQSFCMVDSEHGDVKVGNNQFMIDDVLVSDESFPGMFNLQIIEGASSNLLAAPNTCIVSESTATKLYGNESAIGQTITFYSTYECTVSAVYADMPASTHIKCGMVVSRESWRAITWRKHYFESWGQQGTNFYVTLDKNVQTESVEYAISNAIAENAPWFRNDEDKAKLSIQLQALEDIHLHSSDVQWDSDIVKNNLTTIKAFGLVMVLVLLLACFNYVNLSTATSDSSIKITSVLSALGAKRKQVFLFSIVQTAIAITLAFLLAFLNVSLVLPYFEQLVNIELGTIQSFFNELILYSLFLFAVIMALTGIYPALSFSSNLSKKIMGRKMKISASTSSFSIRSVLVTAQFVMAIFLLVSIFCVWQQVTLLTSKELGFNKEQLVEIQFHKDKNEYELFSQELMKLANVSSVTAASNMPCEYINNENTLFHVGADNTNPPNGCMVGVESNYFEMMGTRILKGEGFQSKQIANNDYVLVNETAARLLELDDPIGVKLKLMGKEYTVKGMVEDVQYRTLHEPSKPVLYSSNYSVYRKMAIKLKPGNHAETLGQIENIWKEHYPNTTMQLSFFDAKLQQNYKTEISQLKLFNILALIGGFIVVLGLIGLVHYMTEQKNKEIGIRKVNGAKISEILAMLNKDFVKWVAIAFVSACPIAWYAMDKWLNNFAYKTELSWWIFAVAGLTALGIAMFTVSLQSWKAARRNPVEALRYE
jgi:putative ABC transport system permease protein